MKIYYSNLSSIKEEYFDLNNLGILISYYGLKTLVKPIYCDMLFLDSGAFSAWRQHKAIDVQKYIQFLKDSQEPIDVYASLDDIGSYKKSISNYKAGEYKWATEFSLNEVIKFVNGFGVDYD